jgi:hypothetical protein
MFIYEAFPSKESHIHPKTIVDWAYKLPEISQQKFVMRAEF